MKDNVKNKAKGLLYFLIININSNEKNAKVAKGNCSQVIKNGEPTISVLIKVKRIKITTDLLKPNRVIAIIRNILCNG